MTFYIIRYGEIALKGKNRGDFELILKNNIKTYLKTRYNLISKLFSVRGRIILFIDPKQNLEISDSDISIDLQPIFGIVSYSKAIKLHKEINLIKEKAIEIFKSLKKENKTFKIETHRLDKSFSVNSVEINKIIGAEIIDNFPNMNVNFKNHDITLGIEIHTDFAYIYSDSIHCFGGLPISSAGNVVVDFQEDKRTLLCCLLLMKRGCNIFLLNSENKHFDLLKVYNNYLNVRVILQDELKNKKIQSIAYSQEYTNIKPADNTDNLLLLYPLALFSDQEVEEGLKKYEI